jgi:putative membrane protein
LPRASALRPIIAALALLSASAVWAQAADADSEALTWSSWVFEPSVVVPAFLFALVYVAGIIRRHAVDEPVQLWRHAAFLGGVATVYLALESPLDAIADHSFWMHQIQHMLLRMIAPMLVALAAPQAMLIAGLPAALRRNAMTPLFGNVVLRRIFSFFVDPAVVTALFVAALYAWQFPPFHNTAILNDTVHDWMHFTMLAAGLLFWWRIFEPRPAPAGVSYGGRLMMLLIVMLTQIGLGAYTTLKSVVLYPSYDAIGRAFGIPPLTDEMIGGFIMWAPSCMMCVVAVIIVVHMWGNHETRLDERRASGSLSPAAARLIPTTGAALVAQARPKNRGMVVALCAFLVSVFVAAFVVGVLNHLDRGGHGLLAHASAPQNLLR